MQLVLATMKSCSISWTSEHHPTTSLMVVQLRWITGLRVLNTRLSWTEFHSQDTAVQKHQSIVSQKRELQSNSCLKKERFGGPTTLSKSPECDELFASAKPMSQWNS